MESSKNLREVVKKVGALVGELRQAGFTETDILTGFVIALHAIPATKAISERPDVADFLGKVKDFASRMRGLALEGAELLRGAAAAPTEKR